MAVDEKNVSKLFSILSNKLRRDILSLLYEKKELSFSDLMNAIEIDTGKMSFHLRNLKMFLKQKNATGPAWCWKAAALKVMDEVPC